MWIAAILAVMLAEQGPTALAPRHPLLGFTLHETESEMMNHFDRTPQVAQGNGYRVLQFHALRPVVIEENLPVDWAQTNASACAGKYAYTAYFGQGQLRSVLHEPDRAMPVNYFFPAGTYRDYAVKTETGYAFRYRVRKLNGGRLLIATLLQPEVKMLDQVVLVREDQLAAAFPLLAATY